MTTEIKHITVGGNEFDIVKIDAWRRLTFVADLQREFLLPLLKSTEGSEIQSLLEDNAEKKIDMMTILSGFSNAIDGKTLEKWTKRILSDGLVTYTRPDQQRVKLGFSEINKFFANPTDIILLIKEAIMFNVEGFADLMKTFAASGDKKAQG